MSRFAHRDKIRLLSYFLFEFLYFFLFLSYRFSIQFIYCVQCFLHSLLFLTLPLLWCSYLCRLHLFCLTLCLFILKMSSMFLFFLIFLSFHSLSFTSRALSRNVTFFLSFFKLFSAWNSSSHFFYRWFHSYDHHVTNLFSISLTNEYCSSTFSWC